MYSNIQHSLPHRVRCGYDILSFGQRAVRILRGRCDMRRGGRQDIMYHQGEHRMPCEFFLLSFLLLVLLFVTVEEFLDLLLPLLQLHPLT